MQTLRTQYMQSVLVSRMVVTTRMPFSNSSDFKLLPIRRRSQHRVPIVPLRTMRLKYQRQPAHRGRRADDRGD